MTMTMTMTMTRERNIRSVVGRQCDQASEAHTHGYSHDNDNDNDNDNGNDERERETYVVWSDVNVTKPLRLTLTDTLHVLQ